MPKYTLFMPMEDVGSTRGEEKS